MEDRLLFLKEFLDNPKEIGSITPSSRFLNKALVEKIKFRKAKYIVEYGPGTGGITKEILKKARKDAKIICFEKNKKLANYLKDKIKDKRLIIINDKAENSKVYLKKLKIKKVDYVVCSIPLSLLGKKVRDRILIEAKHILSEKGIYVSYSYFFSFNALRDLKLNIRKVAYGFSILNLPPAIIFLGQKH